MALVEELISSGYLKSSEIINAFRKIKRRDFISSESQEQAEGNYPLDIGYGQTISQPLTVAFMLELLEPKPGEKILDVGSGSGWTTALLAEIVGNAGKVFALERIPELKKFGEKNTSKYNFVSSGRAEFICGDGYRGLSEQAPFDAILISAAAEKVPEPLVNQLKAGGRMVIPVGHNIKLVIKKQDGRLDTKDFFGFSFVPLVEE